MKKSIFAVAAMLAISGSAFACSNGACVVKPSTSTSVSGNATSTSQTGAYAQSSGNGASFSFNAAGSKATSEGFATGAAAGLGLGQVGVGAGGAAVGGVVTTSGYLLSTSGSLGNASASGFSFAEACADIAADASYKAFQVDGNANGGAKSLTIGGVSTAAGPGAGFAVAGGVGGNVSAFGAAAESSYVGSLTGKWYAPKLKIEAGTSGVAGATSVSLGAIGDANFGNATSSSGAFNGGEAWANSLANAGNCANGCFNSQEKPKNVNPS